MLLVLHPRHKLHYFKNVKWQIEWIERAEEIVRKEFNNRMDHWMQVGPRNVLNLMYVLVNHHPILISYIAVLKTTESAVQNIFDNLPALQAPKPSKLRGELDRYLATDPFDVSDALAWCHEQRHGYPHLHRMALDYLSIPGSLSCHMQDIYWQLHLATSVDVEQMFSQGRLLLSHIRNCLSVQSTRALLCLGVWSQMGYVRDQDIKAATILPEVELGDEAEDLPENWDSI